MATFADLGIISQKLVEGYFGNYLALAVALYFVFLTAYLFNGVPFNVAFVTLTPMFSLFVTSGWLGANEWIVGLVLVILALIIAPVLFNIYNSP